MKGLQEKTDGGIYLHIKHGTICEESKVPKEKFVPIEVTNPRSGQTTTKYIKPYKLVEAMIKRIEWYEREYDGTPFMGWKLVLDADGVPCTLDLPLQSQTATRFMKLAENIDFAKPVEFSAWKTPDDKTALSVKQEGNKVEQKYTRENPGDCPPPVQGFGKKWNYDAQTQFLHERMTQIVIPKLNALRVTEQPDKAAENGNKPAEESTANEQEFSEEKVKLLRRLRRTLPQIDESEAKQAELRAKYFGTSNWQEIEAMDEKKLDECLDAMEDAEIPF